MSIIQLRKKFVGLDVRGIKKTRARSKSIECNPKRVKFADFIDIENPDIWQIYKKPCGWASILVVDDQYINRFIIQQYAEKYNIPIDEAEDGEEAVSKVKEAGHKRCCRGYSLILMDLNMPVMGGIEATRELIKSKIRHEILPYIEIVAVTAFVSDKEKDKCLKVGMTDFIPKPFTINDFVRLVCI